MKENKQYKLKRWYPSLHPEWKHEEITVEKTKDGNYVNFMDCQVVPKHEVENNPDFWELIEEEKPKPLFITDDGVEVFEGDSYYTVTKPYFAKTELKAKEMPYENSDFKYFFHESNADEYIWRNKRVFSYEDMMKAKHSILITNEDIEKLAKKRAEQ